MMVADGSARYFDGLQYCRWTGKVFEQMRRGGVLAVHATVAYHEGFRETVDRLIEWDDRFLEFSDRIAFAGSVQDIEAARRGGRTAILLGLQTPAPIEADIGLVAVLHRLGVRFMQLSYNNQSLLCTGWMEAEDCGITRMGREVIAEMNRLGMVIDMSHSAERSTLEAIDLSARPIVVSHANPTWWRETGRNKSDEVLTALAARGGLVGLSLYPIHLGGGSQTTLEDFTGMVARLADRIGAERIGIGSDLCQDQPDDVVAWMREGRWMRPVKTGERPAFPPQPDWFASNLDFGNIADGLGRQGFSAAEVEGIMSGNWLRFLGEALTGERADAGAAAQPAEAGSAS